MESGKRSIHSCYATDFCVRKLKCAGVNASKSHSVKNIYIKVVQEKGVFSTNSAGIIGHSHAKK